MESGFNPSFFPQLPSLPALLSACTLLKGPSPPVSGALAHYACALVESHLAANGSNPRFDAAFAPLRAFASALPCAPACDLERFADALMGASARGFAQEFHGLAYLAYAACSLHGDLSPRVQQKLAKCEQILGDGEAPGPAPEPAPGPAPGPAPVAELAALALSALRAGATEIAFSALLAAIAEAQK
jgi:hypothetical protein